MAKLNCFFLFHSVGLRMANNKKGSKRDSSKDVSYPLLPWIFLRMCCSMQAMKLLQNFIKILAVETKKVTEYFKFGFDK